MPFITQITQVQNGVKIRCSFEFDTTTKALQLPTSFVWIVTVTTLPTTDYRFYAPKISPIYIRQSIFYLMVIWCHCILYFFVIILNSDSAFGREKKPLTWRSIFHRVPFCARCRCQIRSKIKTAVLQVVNLLKKNKRCFYKAGHARP